MVYKRLIKIISLQDVMIKILNTNQLPNVNTIASYYCPKITNRLIEKNSLILCENFDNSTRLLPQFAKCRPSSSYADNKIVRNAKLTNLLCNYQLSKRSSSIQRRYYTTLKLNFKKQKYGILRSYTSSSSSSSNNGFMQKLKHLFGFKTKTKQKSKRDATKSVKEQRFPCMKCPTYTLDKPIDQTNLAICETNKRQEAKKEIEKCERKTQSQQKLKNVQKRQECRKKDKVVDKKQLKEVSCVLCKSVGVDVPSCKDLLNKAKNPRESAENICKSVGIDLPKFEKHNTAKSVMTCQNAKFDKGAASGSMANATRNVVASDENNESENYGNAATTKDQTNESSLEFNVKVSLPTDYKKLNLYETVKSMQNLQNFKLNVPNDITNTNNNNNSDNKVINPQKPLAKDFKMRITIRSKSTFVEGSAKATKSKSATDIPEIKTKEFATKSEQDLIKSIEDVPKSAQNLTKSVQTLTKPAQDLTKSIADVPKSAQNLTKPAQDLTKSFDDVPKSAQNLPKSVEILTKPVTDTIADSQKSAINSSRSLTDLTKSEHQKEVGSIQMKQVISDTMLRKTLLNPATKQSLDIPSVDLMKDAEDKANKLKLTISKKSETFPNSKFLSKKVDDARKVHLESLRIARMTDKNVERIKEQSDKKLDTTDVLEHVKSLPDPSKKPETKLDKKSSKTVQDKVSLKSSPTTNTQETKKNTFPKEMSSNNHLPEATRKINTPQSIAVNNEQITKNTHPSPMKTNSINLQPKKQSTTNISKSKSHVMQKPEEKRKNKNEDVQNKEKNDEKFVCVVASKSVPQIISENTKELIDSIQEKTQQTSSQVTNDNKQTLKEQHVKKPLKLKIPIKPIQPIKKKLTKKPKPLPIEVQKFFEKNNLKKQITKAYKTNSKASSHPPGSTCKISDKPSKKNVTFTKRHAQEDLKQRFKESRVSAEKKVKEATKKCNKIIKNIKSLPNVSKNKSTRELSNKRLEINTGGTNVRRTISNPNNSLNKSYIKNADDDKKDLRARNSNETVKNLEQTTTKSSKSQRMINAKNQKKISTDSINKCKSSSNVKSRPQTAASRPQQQQQQEDVQKLQNVQNSTVNNQPDKNVTLRCNKATMLKNKTKSTTTIKKGKSSVDMNSSSNQVDNIKTQEVKKTKIESTNNSKTEFVKNAIRQINETDFLRAEDQKHVNLTSHSKDTVNNLLKKQQENVKISSKRDDSSPVTNKKHSLIKNDETGKTKSEVSFKNVETRGSDVKRIPTKDIDVKANVCKTRSLSEFNNRNKERSETIKPKSCDISNKPIENQQQQQSSTVDKKHMEALPQEQRTNNVNNNNKCLLNKDVPRSNNKKLISKVSTSTVKEIRSPAKKQELSKQDNKELSNQVKKQVSNPINKELNNPVKKEVSPQAKKEIISSVNKELNDLSKKERNNSIKKEVSPPVKKEINKEISNSIKQEQSYPHKKEVRPPVKKEMNKELSDSIKQEQCNSLKKEVNPPVKKEINKELRDSIKQEQSNPHKKEVRPPVKKEINKELSDSIKQEQCNSLKKEVSPPVKKEINKELRDSIKQEQSNPLKKEVSPPIKKEINKKLSDSIKQEQSNPLKKEVNPPVKKEIYKELRDSIKQEQSNAVKKEVIPLVKKEVSPPIKKEVNSLIKKEVNNSINKELKDSIKKEVKSPIKKEVNNSINKELKDSIRKEQSHIVKKEVNHPIKKEINNIINKELIDSIKKEQIITVKKEVSPPVKKEANNSINKELSDSIKTEPNYPAENEQSDSVKEDLKSPIKVELSSPIKKEVNASSSNTQEDSISKKLDDPIQKNHVESIKKKFDESFNKKLESSCKRKKKENPTYIVADKKNKNQFKRRSRRYFKDEEIEGSSFITNEIVPPVLIDRVKLYETRMGRKMSDADNYNWMNKQKKMKRNNNKVKNDSNKDKKKYHTTSLLNDNNLIWSSGSFGETKDVDKLREFINNIFWQRHKFEVRTLTTTTFPLIPIKEPNVNEKKKDPTITYKILEPDRKPKQYEPKPMVRYKIYEPNLKPNIYTKTRFPKKKQNDGCIMDECMKEVIKKKNEEKRKAECEKKCDKETDNKCKDERRKSSCLVAPTAPPPQERVKSKRACVNDVEGMQPVTYKKKQPCNPIPKPKPVRCIPCILKKPIEKEMEDCKPFRQKPICPLPVKEIKEHKKEDNRKKLPRAVYDEYDIQNKDPKKEMKEQAKCMSGNVKVDEQKECVGKETLKLKHSHIIIPDKRKPTSLCDNTASKEGTSSADKKLKDTESSGFSFYFKGVFKNICKTFFPNCGTKKSLSIYTIEPRKCISVPVIPSWLRIRNSYVDNYLYTCKNNRNVMKTIKRNKSNFVGDKPVADAIVECKSSSSCKKGDEKDQKKLLQDCLKAKAELDRKRRCEKAELCSELHRRKEEAERCKSRNKDDDDEGLQQFLCQKLKTCEEERCKLEEKRKLDIKIMCEALKQCELEQKKYMDMLKSCEKERDTLKEELLEVKRKLTEESKALEEAKMLKNTLCERIHKLEDRVKELEGRGEKDNEEMRKKLKECEKMKEEYEKIKRDRDELSNKLKNCEAKMKEFEEKAKKNGDELCRLLREYDKAKTALIDCECKLKDNELKLKGWECEKKEHEEQLECCNKEKDECKRQLNDIKKKDDKEDGDDGKKVKDINAYIKCLKNELMKLSDALRMCECKKDLYKKELEKLKKEKNKEKEKKC